VLDLIGECVRLGANFIGFSFHVGSLCDDLDTFQDVFEYISELKAEVESEHRSLKVRFIDIGGGFIHSSACPKYEFREVAEVIKSAIDKYLGWDGIEYIAEPGRLVATSYLDLHLPVIGAKMDNGNKIQHIYVPDGVYGAFNCIMWDHAEPHFEICTKRSPNGFIATTLWGQTCDSMDLIYDGMEWPELKVGDHIQVRNFGAYTYSAISFFDGFSNHKVFVLGLDGGLA
jgi:ornithine decarboxylase